MTVQPRAELLGDLSLEQLRKRRSVKWTTYPDDVLPAWLAEHDFALAEPIQAVLRDAIELGDCGYPNPAPLGEALAGFAAARFDWDVDPKRVLLTADTMSAVVALLRAFSSEGDGVIVNTPIYPPFLTSVAELDRRLVDVPLVLDDAGWKLDLDALERAFADAAVYLLCHPHNPTGRVFEQAELEAVAELAARHGVVVVSDEVHSPLTLPGRTHRPFIGVSEESASSGMTIVSASKAWNIAGLKCALIVSGSDQVQEQLERKLPASLPFHAGHFGVLATVAAYRDGGAWLDAVLEQLDANRRLVGNLLEEHLPAVRYREPEAGYLAWLDCRELGLGDDPAVRFLERGRVAVTSGPLFGAPGRGFARLNFGTSAELVEEAVRRMAHAL